MTTATKSERDTKILLRLTRHSYLEEQREYLEKKFGVLTLVQHPGSVNRESMLQLKERYHPDIVEVVGPLSIISESMRIFAPAPIVKAVMTRTVREGGRVTNDFSHYIRFTNVRVESEIL